MSDYVLQTSKLSKQYKQQRVLKQVDLAIRPGSIYGFIGQNGAGKSTLMRIAAGLTSPTSGGIELFGCRSQAELTRARRRMGAVIESPALFPHMTAAEHLEVYRLQRGIRDKARINQTLRLTGLEETGRKPAAEFSLGMKQRLSLAIALLTHPELLILDEPTNGLDPGGVVALRELLLRLNRESGITLLISSHILSELDLLASDYGIIHQGQLLEQLSVSELKAKCRQYLHIRVDQPELAVQIVQEHLTSPEVELTPDGALHVYAPFGQTSELAAKLFTAGLAVEQLMPMGDGLERYYTKLIGEGTHHESAAV